jgi:hypothetical protein
VDPLSRCPIERPSPASPPSTPIAPSVICGNLCNLRTLYPAAPSNGHLPQARPAHPSHQAQSVEIRAICGPFIPLPHQAAISRKTSKPLTQKSVPSARSLPVICGPFIPLPHQAAISRKTSKSLTQKSEPSVREVSSRNLWKSVQSVDPLSRCPIKRPSPASPPSTPIAPSVICGNPCNLWTLYPAVPSNGHLPQARKPLTQKSVRSARP